MSDVMVFAANRTRAWLFEEALPLWAERGVDPKTGGFLEGLSHEGQPLLALPTRVRVHARQIYAFCRAEQAGWTGAGLEIAERGFEFLTNHGWHEDGGWVHTLATSGEVGSETRDTYDHACFLLAAAALYDLTGRRDVLAWVNRTLRFMDDVLVDRIHGGYLEGVPASGPRRQNPHMHLVEAMLALHEATGDDRFLNRAAYLIELLRDRLIDTATGALPEYFAADWSPTAGPAGRTVEPGHHFEWVWLLSEYARLSGSRVPGEANTLFRFAERNGLTKDGFAIDEIDLTGAVIRGSRRLWPQTELLRALVARFRNGDLNAAGRVEALVDGLFDSHFETAQPGTVCDRFDAAGNPVRGSVPGSTLYHMIGAVLALDGVEADEGARSRGLNEPASVVLA